MKHYVYRAEEEHGIPQPRRPEYDLAAVATAANADAALRYSTFANDENDMRT